MSNPHTGAVTFEAQGRTRTLRFAVNELAALEDDLGMGVAQIAVSLASPKHMRISTVRACFWAGLSQTEPGLTKADAGDIVQALGIGKAVELIGDAMERAFPSEGKATSARPMNRHQRRQAAAGTGKRS